MGVGVAPRPDPRCGVRPRLLVSVVMAGLAAFAGCKGPRAIPAPAPVAPAASEALLEAWTLSRSEGFVRGTADFSLAMERAQAAARLAPDWAAPQRFLDQWLHRVSLTLPDRYAAHLRAGAEGDAGASYLAARLERVRAREGLERAVSLDPSLAWARHGLAWNASADRRLGDAVRDGRAALALARDPSELALFTWALMTYHDARKERGMALELARETLAVSGALALRAPERAMVEALAARLLLEDGDPRGQAAGVRQAIRLLSGPWLTHREQLELVEALMGAEQGLVSMEEVELALAQGNSLRDLEDQAAARDLLVAVRGGAGEARPVQGWRGRLVEAFGPGAEDGETRSALERWCTDLPGELLDPTGMPVQPELAALVRAVRGFVAEGSPDGRAVGARLLEAGWFAEALAWSSRLAPADPEGARQLEIDALRGRAAMGALLNLGLRLDAQAAFVASGAGATRITSASELHDEVASILERCGWLDVPEGGLASPVIGYGPAGSLVHPGPRFSEQDRELGRGDPGEPVPGLAAAFESMGRFALVGRGAGQGGPDATVLRRIAVQPRAGQHLGRAFEGTAVWCQGADVPGRITRRGGAISGAALHEGFYVDVEVVAAERELWRSLLDRFRLGDGSLDRAALALALAAPGASPAAPTGIDPALGAADRMRLSIMCDPSAGAPAPPSLGVLCQGVATHEEAHLCDRMDWYPLSVGRVLSLVGFAAEHGFSGGRIAEALEERAQLVALAVLEDPRPLWVDLLDAADRNLGGGGAPHGAAYRRLLARLIDRIEGEAAAGGWASVPGAGARWIDRLHLIEPDALRSLALREAQAQGLAR